MDSLRKSPPPKTILPPPREESLPFRSSASFDQDALPPLYPDFLERIQPKRKFSWRRLLFITLLTLFLLFLATATLFLYKGFSMSRNIELQNNPAASFFSDIKKLASSFLDPNASHLQGEEAGRINILLLGRAGEHYPGRNLTDTVMVMSIDTKNKKVSLLSLPRDLYAPIPGTSLSTKINSLYQYGLSNNEGIGPLRSSVETITGQTLHYFFVLDFDGFEEVVNALHSISVDVVRDFNDPRYPGKNYSYETFEIKKGWQELDGATALKYVRERHNDPEGDFGRAKRQQQVIQAIKDKAFSLGTFFNIFAVNNILDALGKNIETDMSLPEMEQFISLIRKLDTKNVTSVVVDAWKGDSLLRVSHIQVGAVSAFILVPRTGNWSEVHDISKNIFDLDTIKIRKEAIKVEKPSLTILALATDTLVAQKIKRYVTDEMGFTLVSIETPTSLKNRPEESMIVDRTHLQKPYSLDELIGKFYLKKEDSLSSSLSRSNTSDFVLTLGTDLIDTLSFDEDQSGIIPDDTAFPEMLPPQPMRKN